MSGAQSGATDRVGVIGLGIIGSAWAPHYEAAGVLEGTWNRSPKPNALRPAADPAAQMQGICETLQLAPQLGVSDEHFFRTPEGTVLRSALRCATGSRWPIASACPIETCPL